MTLRRMLRTLGGSALMGLVVGIIFSGEAALVSVEVWVGTTAVAIVGAAIAELIRTARPQPMLLAPAWGVSRPARLEDGPIDLRNLRSLVLTATAHPKVYNRRLKPQLARLADHFLTRTKGLDPEVQGEKVRGLLGDVHWMIDPKVEDRAPTTYEIDRLLDLILGGEVVL